MAPVLYWVYRGLRRPFSLYWTVAVIVCLIGGLGISADNMRIFWLAVGVLTAKLAQVEAAEARARAQPSASSATVARAPRPSASPVEAAPQ